MNRRVRNLRQRIFKAEWIGNHRKVRSLQQLMLRSYSNTLHSVRRVTQQNHGKHSPGVDKVVVTIAAGRMMLVVQLQQRQPWRARPVKRVYILKLSTPTQIWILAVFDTAGEPVLTAFV